MCIPLHHKKTVWVKMSATFIKEDETPYVYLFFTNIDSIKKEECKAICKLKERTDSFIWMLSEYGGNVYISDMDTYELLYLNKCSCNTLQSSEEKLLGRKWCNEGVKPEKENLQNCLYEAYGDYEKMFGEDNIFYCRDIHTLIPEQEALFASQGIHSTLQCAFWDEEVFAGFVGFDECTGLRLWTQEEVSTLSFISQILSIFLQRKKAKELCQEMHQYQDLLDHLGDCIFVVDRLDGYILYTNKKFTLTYPKCDLQKVFQLEEIPTDSMPIKWNHKDAYLCVIEGTCEEDS